MDLSESLKIGSDGFIRYVDHMGSDQAIVQAARISYGAGTKSVSEDRGLIRYLMRHRHTTPFEMCEVKFHVRVPMDAWRQWVRHRTANINEYSTRYSEAIDARSTTEPTGWRLQSKTNKQGSGEGQLDWPSGYDARGSNVNEAHWGVALPGEPDELDIRFFDGFNPEPTPGDYLSAREKEYHDAAQELYQERLAFGVAREQARKDLPLSTYTEAYWKCDLHNILHFLSLRMDPHAQLEIREYANAMGKIVKKLFPFTWEAFEDYRLKAITLSGPEVELVNRLFNQFQPGEVVVDTDMPKRERDELAAKLALLTGEVSVKLNETF